jgi:ubiquinone/menaquinone biosynthesis C-methylase UbiE
VNGNSAQAFSVKRAQVEFHNFASLGEPARALRVYAEENQRRGAMIRKHLEFIGPMSPFLEIGANAGHTSYMVANEFGADGFALDISADALRHGLALQDEWGLARSPIRVAGDAVNLPFADGSLRLVMTFQTLSQFMDLEAVFLEVKRVLAPGGVFFFSEEPLKRMLSMRLYRCPYYETMKPWERKLFDWGLLDFFVRDVIGAHQEESFGIRQNHTMALGDWDRLVRKHFAAQEYELFVPERGWGERVAKRLAVAIDPYRCRGLPESRREQQHGRDRPLRIPPSLSGLPFDLGTQSSRHAFVFAVRVFGWIRRRRLQPSPLGGTARALPGRSRRCHRFLATGTRGEVARGLARARRRVRQQVSVDRRARYRQIEAGNRRSAKAQNPGPCGICRGDD